MRHLLDINVLIALMDPDHAFHERAHTWWSERKRPWSSCPITENGFIRIMSSAAYSRSQGFSVTDIAFRLSVFISKSDHSFWPDTLTIRDEHHFLHTSILSPKHLTDLYLLALAVEHGGQLVTFDQHIPLNAVATARPKHLIVI
jgi:hypothetical protein